MKYTINKIVPETIEIDLSKPIYRSAFASTFYRLTAGDSEEETKTTIISERSISQISNYSQTINLINCADHFKESSEEEFRAALDKELQALNLTPTI